MIVQDADDEERPQGRIAESEMLHGMPCLVPPGDVLTWMRQRQVRAAHGGIRCGCACSSKERLDRRHGGSPRGRAAYGTM